MKMGERLAIDEIGIQMECLVLHRFNITNRTWWWSSAVAAKKADDEEAISEFAEQSASLVVGNDLIIIKQTMMIKWEVVEG